MALAKEWRADGIRVTQVNPGLVDTHMAAEVVAALKESGRSINITGRPGHADEAAALVHYEDPPPAWCSCRDDLRSACDAHCSRAVTITLRSSSASSCFSACESSRTISPS